MGDELHTSSNLLDAALRKYRDACFTIANNRNLDDVQGGVLQGVPDVILGELDRAHSHKNQLQQSILAISRARNAIPSISPIAVLPPDVLSQIFSVVVGMLPAYPDYLDYPDYSDYPEYLGDEESYRTPRLNYPEALAHVCSRWRQVALNMRWLWARIDVPFGLRTTNLWQLARARAFVLRANPLLLDLNICSGMGDDDFGTNLGSFCTDIAPRTRSLSMTLAEYFHDRHIPVLEDILKNCVPGVLDRLIIRNDVELADLESVLIESFEAPEREDDLDIQRINVPQKRIDDCLLPVRILELVGVYFPWSSPAYHNLTEFHLFNACQVAFITQPQLRHILAASPRLRILSLFVKPMVPQSCVSVRLNELEVLNLGPMNEPTFQALFQLILPGPKLSRVALNMRISAFDEFKLDFEVFLARSKAKQPRFNFQDRYRYIQLEAFEFFKSIPDLEVLAFSNLHLARQGNGSPLPQEPKSSTNRPQLKTLYLGYCKIDLDYLQRMTSILSIHTLVLSGCLVRLHMICSYIKAEILEQELAKLVPTLKFIPVEDWVKE